MRLRSDPFSKLPEPFSFIFTWFAAMPLILWLALSITNFFVNDFLILRALVQIVGHKMSPSLGPSYQ
ncbi:hypothetical protein LOK49_LG08G00671 [Camellia lanceoleosa]|uniref:Uncharacterized protein n=1 Tax=Camellia lanceoleosa TaxID=1840588 RepID=A0ACC0GS81_9ERIC|nr:hypothetical protein LOK49_LG08G00671 [Camellia lanceoleosa]